MFTCFAQYNDAIFECTARNVICRWRSRVQMGIGLSLQRTGRVLTVISVAFVVDEVAAGQVPV
jgi:hypothetical protein